jgi:hypothetical protein
MKLNRNGQHLILWLEAAGFLLLIALSWVDEYHQVWQESAVESGAVLAVWATVHFFTLRLIKRLHYLEGFLRVCAWCKKIEHNASWMPLEQFFDREFHTKATHGMCPACASRFKSDLERDIVPGA